jgi:hypothetical protein
MQFVESEYFVFSDIQTTFGHESEASLWRRRLVLAQIVNVRLRFGDFVVADVSVTFAGHENYFCVWVVVGYQKARRAVYHFHLDRL